MPTDNPLTILLIDPDIQTAGALIPRLQACGHSVTHLSRLTGADLDIHYDAALLAWTRPDASELSALLPPLLARLPAHTLILAVDPRQRATALHEFSARIDRVVARPYQLNEVISALREVQILHASTEAEFDRDQGLERVSLLSVAVNLFSTQDETKLLNQIVHTLVNHFHYALSYFRLIEPDGSLDTYACAGSRIDYVHNPKSRLPPGAGVTGRAVQAKRPVWVEDVRTDPDFYFPDMREREHMVAMLSVPLLFGGEVLGVLSCHLNRRHQFSDTEIQVVVNLANLATVALSNARSLRTLHQLSEFSRELAQGFELATMLQTIVRHAQWLGGADGAAIYPYDPEKERFEVDRFVASGVGVGQQLAIKGRPRPDGILRKVLRERVVRVIDVDGALRDGLIKPSTRDGLVGQGVRAFIGIALMAHQPAGALFLNFRQAGHLPSPEVLKPFEALSHQAALAIERAWEYEHRQREQQLLKITADVTKNVTSVRDTWSTFLAEAIRLTGARLGSISSITPDGRHLRQIARLGDYPPGYVAPLLEIGGHSIQGQVAQMETSVLIPNVRTDPHWSAYYHAGVSTTHSELTAPIYDRAADGSKVILGIVNLEHPEPNSFGRHDLELIELLCVHAKIAIRVAEDFEQLTHRQAQLKRRQDQLETLVKSAKTITAALDQHTHLQTILEQAAHLAGAHFATIQRKLDDGLKFEAVHPPERLEDLLTQIPDGVMPLSGPGLTVEAARTRRPVRVNNVSTHANFVDGSGGRTQSELAVPLLANGEVWGVLNVENPARDAFDESHEMAMTALADFVVAIMQQIERQAELQAEKQQRAAAETVTEIAVLTVELAHNLKNRLSHIPPEVDKLRASLNLSPGPMMEDVERARRRLDLIDSKSREALSTLGQISRPFDFRLEKVDPAEVLAAAIQNLGPTHGTIIEPPVWGPTVRVIASAPLLEDVFSTLLLNSLDAMPGGGRVTIRAHTEAEWLSIVIRDTGLGIPLPILEVVRQFLPGFTTKQAANHQSHGGFGYGLYTVNWFMRRLGGSVTIDSQTAGEGHGTTVTLRMPQAIPTQWARLRDDELRRDLDRVLYRRT